MIVELGSCLLSGFLGLILGRLLGLDMGWTSIGFLHFGGVTL